MPGEGMGVHTLTITAASQLIAKGDLSATEFAKALIAQAEARASLNALVSQDPEAMLAAAAACDARRTRDERLGALAGMPLVFKDNIDTSALPTTAGTGALAGRTPEADAPVARRLFAAGAILAGKANMHELAFGITSNNAVTGAVRNPHNPEMIAGGSSGGTAAAVAAHLAPAGLGTDTGGSVRIPAALCGIAGLRPTLGRYPGQGIVPVASLRDTAGPMARCVADLALLDGLLAGETSCVSPVDTRGLRLGVPRGYFYDKLDPGVARVAEGVLAQLADAGAVLVDVDVANVAELNDAVSFPVALFEVMRELPGYLREHRYDLTLTDIIAGIGSPDVRGALESQLGDEAVPEAAYRAAVDVHRPALRRAYANCFRDNAVEALVFPTTILPARPIGDDETVELNGERVPTFQTYIHNTDPGSNAGLPGVSLPAGSTSDGLPVGIELDGPEGSDHRLLAIAAAIEERLVQSPTATP